MQPYESPPRIYFYALYYTTNKHKYKSTKNNLLAWVDLLNNIINGVIILSGVNKMLYKSNF